MAERVQDLKQQEEADGRKQERDGLNEAPAGQRMDKTRAVSSADHAASDQAKDFRPIRCNRRIEIVPSRNSNANASVTRLIIRLRGTADFASNPTTCIKTGSRNSPPPRPISPPRPPIGMHQANARRKKGQVNVRCIEIVSICLTGDLTGEWAQRSMAICACRFWVKLG